MAWFVSLLTVVGVAIGVATPAKAWSYCEPVQGALYVVNLYYGQGYCFPRQTIEPQFGGCYTLVGTAVNDWAGSVWNRSSAKITLSAASNCTGLSLDVASNTSYPDLYAKGLWHNVSSIRFS